MNKIIFDEDKCIGCGYCFSIATENFTCNDEGRASMINDNVTNEAIEASEGCPVSAIAIKEVKTDTKKCNCKENCTCGETCDCGDECNCPNCKGKEKTNKSCNCGNNCTCGENCECGDDCKCNDTSETK